MNNDYWLKWRNYLPRKGFRAKNSWPQAVKHGARTDLAGAAGESDAAESEKRGNVNYVIGKPFGHLYRREYRTD